MLTEGLVLEDFGLGSLVKGVVEGIGHVNYEDAAVFFNNNVGA